MNRRSVILWSECQRYDDDIEYVREKSPWISSNMPPNNDNNVFYTNYLSGALGVGYFLDNQWYEAYTGEKVYGVTHFIPIPTLENAKMF